DRGGDALGVDQPGAELTRTYGGCGERETSGPDPPQQAKEQPDRRRVPGSSGARRQRTALPDSAPWRTWPSRFGGASIARRDGAQQDETDQSRPRNVQDVRREAAEVLGRGVRG